MPEMLPIIEDSEALIRSELARNKQIKELYEKDRDTHYEMSKSEAIKREALIAEGKYGDPLAVSPEYIRREQERMAAAYKTPPAPPPSEPKLIAQGLLKEPQSTASVHRSLEGIHGQVTRFVDLVQKLVEQPDLRTEAMERIASSLENFKIRRVGDLVLGDTIPPFNLPTEEELALAWENFKLPSTPFPNVSEEDMRKIFMYGYRAGYDARPIHMENEKP